MEAEPGSRSCFQTPTKFWALVLSRPEGLVVPMPLCVFLIRICRVSDASRRMWSPSPHAPAGLSV